MIRAKVAVRGMKSLTEVQAPVDLGDSTPVLIDQGKVDDFAALTGDHQWVHTDPERARTESPYGGPIVHGALLLALVPVTVGELLPVDDATLVINTGVDRVRFRHPVAVGDTIRGHATLTETNDLGDKVIATVRVTITAEATGRIACTGTQTMVYSR